MASTIESPQSQQYVDFDEYIDYQLERTRGNIKTVDILTAFAFVAVFVLAYLLLFVVCDHWLFAEGFSQTARVVLLSLVGLISAGWLAWKVVWPYLRQVNALFAAKVIEQSQPELRSTLLNLIDARTSGKPLSPAILSVMEKRAAVSMSQTNVDEAVDRRPLMWACYAVLALVAMFSLYTLLTPKKVSASVWRALFPAAAVEAPTRTVIEKVTPGDVEVIPGTRLEVLADISGDVPEKVTLLYSTADREFVNEPIEMREDPNMPRRYRGEIIGTNGEGIQQDLQYHIVAGDDRSNVFTVTVSQPPTANVLELHFNYPEYMEREAKTRTTGNIDDYEGVMITFLAEGNMPLKTATITFHDDQGTNYRAEAVPMSAVNPERTRFRANWVLSIREDDGLYPRYYTIEVKNERGESDPNPIRWPIRIHPDQRPEAKILNPRERELERPANAILPLVAFASDDFKVKSLVLWKQLNEEKPIEHTTLFQGAQASLSVEKDWRLNEGWSLKTGDRISYWVAAQDNRTPHAGKRNSDKQTIIIQPEEPEEVIQQQREADRQPPPDENQDPADKNQDQRPKDNGTNQENQPGEPPPQPQDNQPQNNQPQDNQSNDNSDGGSGTESQPGQGGNSGDKSTKQPGEPVKKDGSEDDRALESLHKHINQNQNQPGQGQPDNQNAENQDNANPDNTKPGSENKTEPQPPGGNAEKPETKPGEPSPQENNNTKKPESKPGENSTKPDKGNDPNNTQDNTPMPNDSGNPSETEPQPNPNSEKKEPGSTKPGETKKPGDNAEENKNNAEDKIDPKTNNPDSRNTEGGSDDNTAQPTPSESEEPASSKNNKGADGAETKPGEPGTGRQAEEPLKGNETPAENEDNAQKREATGDEKGPATSETDPDANPKRANNPLDRKDPEKPTATRQEEGQPENLPTNPDNKQPNPMNKPGENSTTKPKNPMNKPGDPNTNPEEQPGTPGETNPDRKPANPDKQPNVGEDDLRGPGRPEDQQAKKPDGGENGSSKQNQEGTPGGNEKGPGDTQPKPGEQDTTRKPTPGKPGDETGEGSRTRPTDQDQEPFNRQPKPGENGNPKETQPGQETGQPGTERRPGQPTDQKTENAQHGPGGPPEFGQQKSGDGPITPEQAQAAEEANLEYGREATDLALKKLENELQRGDVNEQWLKEMGWDKADAAKFLDRMKDRLNPGDENSPEALAKQRQFNEWLKRLNKPTTTTNRRTGSGVENEPARDIFNTRKIAPPAELRDIYEAYQRGISERSK